MTPPAPCSPAPGLPLPRRPAPRRLLVALALALTILLICVPAAAESITINIDEDIVDSKNYELGSPGSGHIRPATIRVYAAENYPVGSRSTLIWFGLITTNNQTIHANQTPINLRYNSVSGTLVGEGTMGYYRDSQGLGYAYVDFEWSAPLSGSQRIFMENSGKYAWQSLQFIELEGGSTVAGALSNDAPMGFGDALTSDVITRSKVGTYTANKYIPFRHIIDVEEISEITDRISIYRNIEGVAYQSAASISGASGEYVQSTGSTNISQIVGNADRPYTVAIDNLHGQWYNRTFFAGSPPGDNAPVAISVRSAETGAPVPNASVVVLDAAGSPPTEVVNQTLPSGSGTFSLQTANYLRYHASASAGGYTLLSPILFGVGDDGTTIILWMAPDAPPDDPIEEGKSMLYGYVSTQGSQQPISGATVSLDGYGSTTTSSTGFYLFNNVTPGAYTISASAPLHDALSEPVTVETVATPYNLALKGHFLLTVSAKDADDLTTLHNTTISLSDGQESTQNPATFTADYGPYTITAAAGGYYPTTQSAYVDRPGTTTATVLLTAKPEPVPPPEMPNYPPHNVQFKIMNIFGAPIEGVNVTAVGQETSAPTWDWFYSLLGLSTDTVIEGSTMTGETGTDGSIDFMMFESVKYTVSFIKAGEINETLTLYPHESFYPVRAISLSSAIKQFFPEGANEYQSVLVNVSTSTEDDGATITVRYQDLLAGTTGGTVQLTQTNGSPGEDETLSSYSITGSTFTHDFEISDYEGQSYLVRVRATSSNFTAGINRDFGISFPGERLNFGLPDGLLIWIAMFLMTITALMFGPSAAIQGLPVICLEGWIFLGIGWLRDLGDVNAAGLLVIMSFVAVVANIMGASKRARQQG